MKKTTIFLLIITSVNCFSQATIYGRNFLVSSGLNQSKVSSLRFSSIPIKLGVENILFRRLSTEFSAEFNRGLSEKEVKLPSLSISTKRRATYIDLGTAINFSLYGFLDVENSFYVSAGLGCIAGSIKDRNIATKPEHSGLNIYGKLGLGYQNRISENLMIYITSNYLKSFGKKNNNIEHFYFENSFGCNLGIKIILL